MSGYDDTAIGSFDFHHSMLADSLRTESFLEAILTTVQPGDVVVDVGCGTGVLSMFSAMAGARKVYAIEREPIIRVAREIAELNGFDERIVFVEAPSTDVDLPERADVVVSETVGNVGFDEGWLAWMSDARRRLAKPAARFIPSRIEVHGAPVEVPRDIDMVRRWSEPLLALDFGPLQRVAANNVMWADFNPAALLAEPAMLAGADVGDASVTSIPTTFTMRRPGTVHGLGAWFRCTLTDGLTLSNAPPNPVPSWEQGLFPIVNGIDLSGGDSVRIGLDVAVDGSDWSWRIDDQHMTTANGRLTAGTTGLTGGGASSRTRAPRS